MIILHLEKVVIEIDQASCIYFCPFCYFKIGSQVEFNLPWEGISIKQDLIFILYNSCNSIAVVMGNINSIAIVFFPMSVLSQ